MQNFIFFISIALLFFVFSNKETYKLLNNISHLIDSNNQPTLAGSVVFSLVFALIVYFIFPKSKKEDFFFVPTKNRWNCNKCGGYMGKPIGFDFTPQEDRTNCSKLKEESKNPMFGWDGMQSPEVLVGVNTPGVVKTGSQAKDLQEKLGWGCRMHQGVPMGSAI